MASGAAPCEQCQQAEPSRGRIFELENASLVVIKGSGDGILSVPQQARKAGEEFYKR